MRTVATEQIAEGSLHPRARITGAIYLLYFLTAVSAGFLMKGMVVTGNASARANNILAHRSLFQFGAAVGLLATAWYIALTALFYELFKPVNRRVSLLAAFFSLVGCAVQAAGSLFQLAPLVVLERGPYSSVFTVEQSRALALLFLQLHTQATSTDLVFFGFYDLLIGSLILRSIFLPRILGVLMAIAGLGWLTFLLPAFASSLSPWNQILGFLGEFLLMLRLLVRGVNVQRWKEQAIAAELTSQETI